METYLFTASSIADLLSNIEELSDKDIYVVENNDGGIDITVGESTYHASPSNPADVDVNEK